MLKSILPLALLAVCAGTTMAAAADVDAKTTIGGEAFFDFTHINQQQNGNDVAATGTGFDVKRFYLIANHSFDDIWSANLTTDAQYVNSTTSTVTTTSGSTTVVTTAGSGSVAEVFIKRLYLQAKLNDAFVLHVGAYNASWAPFVEGLYGYRYIEKTATDRLGFANTADWGLNVTGKVADGLVTYSASVVNGGGFKNPSRSKDVDFDGRVGVSPVEWLTLGAGFYSGHLGQITQAVSAYASNTATRFDFVAAVQVSGIRVGAEYFQAKNYKAASATTGVYSGPGGVVVATTATGTVVSDEATGFSSWASYEFAPQYSVFARFDQAKPSKDIHTNLKDRYFHAGVAYKPIKQLDLSLVYKNEKVDNGAISISSADANGSYTIGGTGVAKTGPFTGGKFSEVGIYAHYNF